MTTRSWIGSADNGFVGAGDLYGNAANWSPSGAPQPGDTLDIGSGTPFDNTTPLDRLAIMLGSPSAATTQLWLSGITIGSDTTVGTFTGQVSAATPTLALASVTNNGTIGSPTSGSSSVNYNFVDYDGVSNGQPVNNGVIDVADGQTANLYGANQVPAPGGGFQYFPGNTLINNGQINVYGTLQEASLTIGGSGTVTLNGISQGLGLPEKPAEFIDNNDIGGGGFASTQTIAFNGGTLVAQGDFSIGTILNFATNPLNMIELQNSTLDRDYMYGGVLNVIGDMSNGSSYDFKMTTPDIAATNAHFVVEQNGSSIDITWNASAPLVGNYVAPHPLPPPHGPYGPPGHVIS
jgi:hypothetical protein